MSTTDSSSQARSVSPRRTTPVEEPSGDDLRLRILQHTLEEVSTRQEDDSDCCVICLEAISEECEAIPCKHRNFDYLCLVSWLQESPKCPLCKATVSKVLYGLQDENANTYTVTQPRPSSSTQQPRALPRHRSSFTYRSRRPFPRPYRTRPLDETTNDASSEISRRREIYRNNRYSKHVGSNRLSRYRELTPALFCTDTELTSRARMWIRRELQVFSFLTPHEPEDTIPRPGGTNTRNPVERRRANNAEFLLEYIVAILKSVDIMGSGGQAEDMLADFLGRDNTRLFLHELRAWLRSPYTKLADWDRAVQYDDKTEATSSRVEAQRSELPQRRDDRSQGQPRKGDFYRPRRNQMERKGPSARHEPYKRMTGERRT
ncbi:Fc.00g028220.m01.CDS01 [Cosmosporella sp. VM-42]